VRLSLGVQNTPQQVDDFLRALEGVLARFKQLTAMAV
jgi:selenocysteine lyase/cysteine desulfurase